jgi:hypothetical protein
MAIAVENTKELLEGADLVPVASGQDAGDLMKVSQVVGGPGSEEF